MKGAQLVLWPNLCLPGEVVAFSGNPAILTEHIETFQHVFTDDLTELVVSALATQGCDFLSTTYAYLCSYPYCMTAVCPVACGCVTEPDHFACPVSCATGNVTEH